MTTERKAMKMWGVPVPDDPEIRDWLQEVHVSNTGCVVMKFKEARENGIAKNVTVLREMVDGISAPSMLTTPVALGTGVLCLVFSREDVAPLSSSAAEMIAAIVTKNQPKPPIHLATIREEEWRPGSWSRRAGCICGWRGPERASLELLTDDAMQHEREYYESNPPPESRGGGAYMPVLSSDEICDLVEILDSVIEDETHPLTSSPRGERERLKDLHLKLMTVGGGATR